MEDQRGASSLEHSMLPRQSVPPFIQIDL